MTYHGMHDWEHQGLFCEKKKTQHQGLCRWLFLLACTRYISTREHVRTTCLFFLKSTRTTFNFYEFQTSSRTNSVGFFGANPETESLALGLDTWADQRVRGGGKVLSPEKIHRNLLSRHRQPSPQWSKTTVDNPVPYSYNQHYFSLITCTETSMLVARTRWRVSGISLVHASLSWLIPHRWTWQNKLFLHFFSGVNIFREACNDSFFSSGPFHNSWTTPPTKVKPKHCILSFNAHKKWVTWFGAILDSAKKRKLPPFRHCELLVQRDPGMQIQQTFSFFFL